MRTAVVLMIAISFPLTASAARLRHFTHRSCGYSFSYPADWRVVVPHGEHDHPCDVLLMPRDYAKRMREYDVDVYTVRVSWGDGGFDAAAREAGFYVQGDIDDPDEAVGIEQNHIGEWMFMGQRPVLADELIDGDCRGLEASASARCYHEQGGYAGQCDIVSAFITRNGRWLAAIGHDENVIHTILATAVPEGSGQ